MQNGVPKMDKFAEVEWRRYAHSGGAAREAMGKQFARLVMAHIDCDTIPFFWRYASRFTIFDNIFATEDTPSTPNAVAMIAGQSGETQWVKHPSDDTRRHPGRRHRTDQRHDQRRDLFRNGDHARSAIGRGSAAMVGLRVRQHGRWSRTGRIPEGMV